MKNNLSVDQQVEIVKEAIERGAKVQLSFFHITSREEAAKIIDRMAEITGGEVQDRNNIETFSLNAFTTPVDCSVFYNLSNKEKKEKLLKQLEAIE